MSAPFIDVDPADAEARARQGAVLLDVREPDEWNAGHIAGAVHLPLGRLADIGDLVAPGAAPVVAVCRSGNRSGRAAEALAAAGYDVVNLGGGMKAWATAGLPVVDDGGRPGTVI